VTDDNANDPADMAKKPPAPVAIPKSYRLPSDLNEALEALHEGTRIPRSEIIRLAVGYLLDHPEDVLKVPVHPETKSEIKSLLKK
jgi:predicted DNA-binding protein